MRVELRTEAITDLIEASWFYERQRPGLGEQFTDAMFVHLASLSTIAGGHEMVFGLHRMLAKKFPYALYYRVAGELIDVVAILDCRRNPASISRTIVGRTETGEKS